MSEIPNRLNRFWQELKRRRVFKVIAMYAGTAFIILQLVDIITQPLQLPDWTLTLVIILLAMGFIFTLLIAWIYDITPEGIKKTGSVEPARKRKSISKRGKRRFKSSDIIITALVIIIAILVYPKIFKQEAFEKLKSFSERISVAVMPFQNMTNDTIWNVWQEGIQVNIITSLSNDPEELHVRQAESIKNILQGKGLTDYASITPSIANTISQKLDANIFINGSINLSGSTIRLNSQIVNSKTKDVLKSFQIDGTPEHILPLIDSLSLMVKNFLIVSEFKREVQPDYQHLISTSYPEAYRFFIYGQNAYNKKDFSTAVKLFSQALDIDSGFTFAALLLGFSYGNQDQFEEAKKWTLKVYEKRANVPIWQKIWINWGHAMYFETPYEEIIYLKQLQEFDDQMPFIYGELGYCYLKLNQYKKATTECERALDLYDKWDLKPVWVYNYIDLGNAYHKLGEYRKEKKLYKIAGENFPDDPDLVRRQAILYLTEKEMSSANKYITNYISILNENSSSEADISISIAKMYSEAGMFDKAEEYYRKALSLNSENPSIINSLAYFLIDKDRNIAEGLEYADTCLKFHPDDYTFLHTKGWGLYKSGNYQDALLILKKSWDLRREKAVYNTEAYLHLEAAKKAVANLKHD